VELSPTRIRQNSTVLYEIYCLDLQYAGGPPRGLEELKARYFGVARALMVGRAGGEDLIANEALVKHPFNAAHELCAFSLGLFRCCHLPPAALKHPDALSNAS